MIFRLCLHSFYQKVPEELPALEKHQVYGLATPEDFTLPPHHPLWTEETYAAFEASSDDSEKYDTKVRLAGHLRKIGNLHIHLYTCIV